MYLTTFNLKTMKFNIHNILIFLKIVSENENVMELASSGLTKTTEKLTVTPSNCIQIFARKPRPQVSRKLRITHK